MDVQNLLTAISTVGFPIVCCGGLFWMMNNTLAKVTDALNNNTIALTKLIERMDSNG